MTELAPETRSDWALRRLRTAILSGELPPGTRLRAEELAARWQVSPTPLREAFQRLGGARLVEVSPQRGVRVAEFTLADAADLYALRLRLEPPALRESLEHSDDAHRAAVSAAYDRLAGARSIEDGTQAHLDFHAALLERCPSVWTKRVIGVLGEHAQRYVLLGAQKFRSGRGPVAEHETLRDTVLAGDVEGSVATLEEHLRGTLESVRVALAAQSKAVPAAAGSSA
jgi:DNA-binding GntR family transcriptional regulator